MVRRSLASRRRLLCGHDVRQLRDIAGGKGPEAAVRQVTGLPAGIFRLADAGTIAPGKPADLAAFDPETIDGTADFLHPHTPASGILFTLIGGEFVYRNGSDR